MNPQENITFSAFLSKLFLKVPQVDLARLSSKLLQEHTFDLTKFSQEETLNLEKVSEAITEVVQVDDHDQVVPTVVENVVINENEKTSDDQLVR